MSKIIQLMCQNNIVAQQSSEVVGGWEIIRPELLPHNLDFESTDVGSDVSLLGTQSLYDYRRNQLISWLSRRILSIDRVNAKKILNSLNLTQNQSPMDKANIAIAYRAVSVCDSWWLKFGPEDTTNWEDVCLFSNSLSNAMALIGLSGGSMTLEAKHGIDTGTDKTAELSSRGSYAKGWFRSDAGKLYLYKASTINNNESYREVCASKIINHFNVYANLEYTLETVTNPLNGVVSTCSKCMIMSDNSKAVVHAWELDSYLIRHGSNVITYVRKHYLREFAQMVVLDYLLANSDRHSENWGFYRDMNTGKILGLHPLYDHNNCFDPDLLYHDDTVSILVGGKTMRQAAHYYIKYAELRLIKALKKKEFPNQKAYEVFKRRCTQLGIALR